MTMKLLQPAQVTSAFLKMGIVGFQGAGKTKTATLVGKGLVHHCRKLKLPYADKPAAFLDTETGSDWIIPDFRDAGIELVAAKTRSFADLLTVTREAQENCSLLIVDSLTHFWKDLCDSYAKQKAKQFNKSTYRLQFQDWGYLKGEWSKFTDIFVNSPLHMILAGRAGFEYDYFEDDDGTKQLEKTGIKMKAEGEFGFEPSLLIQMELCQTIEGKKVAEVWREAHVVKDRSTLIDGKTFINPDFKNFLPHIERLNLGGKQLGVDTSRTSEHLVTPDKKDWTSTHRAIVLEEIEAVLVKHYPSTGKEDKLAKLALIEKHFGTTSWTAVTMMTVDELRVRFDALHQELESKPSHYARAIEREKPAEMDDSLPEHSAPPAAAGEASALPLKDKLLAQLATFTTISECTHWGIAVTNMELPGADYVELSKALMAKQQEIAKNANGGNGSDHPDAPRKNGPDGDKTEQPPPPK